MHITNCRITSDAGYYVIQVVDGYTGHLYLDHVEIDGAAGPNDTCVLVSNTTATDCQFHNSGNDLIKFGSNATFDSCYFFDPFINGVDPHFDGAQTLGCDTVLFTGCFFDLPEVGMTSCIILTHGGATTNVHVTGCLLSGGGYSIYGGYQSGVDTLGSATGTQITDNWFVYNTGSSPMTSIDPPDVTHSGNRWFDGPNAGQSID